MRIENTISGYVLLKAKASLVDLNPQKFMDIPKATASDRVFLRLPLPDAGWKSPAAMPLSHFCGGDR